MSPLWDFFDSVFLPLRLRSRRPRTVDLYRTTLRSFERFLGRIAGISDLNDLTVSGYLAWQKSRELSPYSIEKERANLLAIWRFAIQRKKVECWPNVEREICPKRIPLAWSQKEIELLFAALQQLRGSVSSIPESIWWTALHYVLWDTGERISAAMSLDWETVDLAGRYIVFRAEGRKGGRDDRIYQIAEDTANALASLPHRRCDVFPWPYSKTYLWFRYQQILREAGLPFDRKSKFHRVRRSVASHYEAAGGNATELLGHSSRSVTRQYLDPRIIGIPSAASRLFRPIKKV